MHLLYRVEWFASNSERRGGKSPSSSSRSLTEGNRRNTQVMTGGLRTHNQTRIGATEPWYSVRFLWLWMEFLSRTGIRLIFWCTCTCVLLWINNVPQVPFNTFMHFRALCPVTYLVKTADLGPDQYKHSCLFTKYSTNFLLFLSRKRCVLLSLKNWEFLQGVPVYTHAYSGIDLNTYSICVLIHTHTCTQIKMK
jgi:hypothetical protein